MADAPTPDAVEAEPSPPKKKRKGLLLLSLPLVALAIGGGGGFYQYRQALVSPSGEEVQEPIEYGEFTALTGIIVNPAGTGGRRYLMVDLAFESDDDDTIEEVTSRDVVIRDTIVRLLGARTVEQLASVANREALKDTLLESVNAVLEGEVDRLYFTQYVLQ